MVIRLKKLLFLGLFFNSLFLIFAQNIILDPEKERQFNRSIAVKLDDNSPVFATITSKVVSISNDPKDKRNFGRYVEILFSFKEDGKTIEVHVIYSNLKSVKVKIRDMIISGDTIGYSGGGGTNIHRSNDLYIYIYTKEDCENLKKLTNNSFLLEDGVYWWNPAFLYENYKGL
jgi:hypothetical protein